MDQGDSVSHFLPLEALMKAPARENKRSHLGWFMRDLGRILVVLGGTIMLVGFFLWSGFGLGWFGRLPGDIRIGRGNSVFYFPIVTCLIISILLTLILSFFRR